ncbi:SDR family NAD(P)-dependent oxidoreductase [Sorangium sp. So ce726]|uniref:SDR family NAD(P)-dependent oxidoreductase n=1 Tax=Sorangium sp. So ce726 TaxID=3133319 RepID=UPI003F5E8B5B
MWLQLDWRRAHATRAGLAGGYLMGALAMSLDGVCAVVTGASRGLGREMARALAAAGAHVVACGRDEGALTATVAAIRGAGGDCVSVVLDVTDSHGVEAAAERIWSETPVDVLVNNAGVMVHKPALAVDDAEWDRVLRTNLTGTFFCCRSFGRRMLARGGGKIVNMASDLGIRGGAGWSAYSASKGGLITMSKSLAWEWAPHVTVNVLAPGAFETDMNRELLASPGFRRAVEQATPLGRLGMASELGPIAVYLASAVSDFMTGAVISLDGGIRRS